jgi:pilus assembly protein Flp/PilA
VFITGPHGGGDLLIRAVHPTLTANGFSKGGTHSTEETFPMGVLRELFRRDSVVARVLSDEAGATAIEYGLIAALIAVAAIAAFQLVGTNLTSVFNGVSSDL